MRLLHTSGGNGAVGHSPAIDLACTGARRSSQPCFASFAAGDGHGLACRLRHSMV